MPVPLVFSLKKIVKQRRARDQHSVVLYAFSDTMWQLVVIKDGSIVCARCYMLGCESTRRQKMSARLDFNSCVRLLNAGRSALESGIF